jgi:hypothetical protein
MIVWLLIMMAGLLVFGFLVDLWYKRREITNLNPEENAKHVSEYDRAYLEAHMSNLKDDFNNGPF